VSKLTEQRTANTTALLTPYAAKLQQLEATLTKNDRVEEAKEVMDYRTSLKADSPVPQATMTASTPTPTALPQTTAAIPKVKGDDRKAAEWVLSVGGTLSIEGNFKTITSPADLPKGRFSIKTISIDNNRVGIKPFTDGDFQALAGLDGLKSVNLNKLPVSSGIFATLGTCSNLESIAHQYNRFGDELWIHLAPLQKLVSISYQYDGLKPTGVGIGQLSKSPIRSLHLGSLPISDEGLAEMAGFSDLEHLGLENAKITDAGIKVIAGLKKLRSFHVHNTGITAAGLTALKSCPITNLGIGRTASELAVQAADLALIFPKLTTLQMPRDCLPTPDDWKAIAAAFPKLERISFDSQPFNDEHLQGLEAFPALEELNLHYAKLTDAGVIALSKLKKLDWLHLYEAQLTDASLEVLASMKSLKRVKLPQPGNGITAEGLAKFKKQRPDVKVE
jgi:Leucine-rich repeat (LRR) protein